MTARKKLLLLSLIIFVTGGGLVWYLLGQSQVFSSSNNNSAASSLSIVPNSDDLSSSTDDFSGIDFVDPNFSFSSSTDTNDQVTNDDGLNPTDKLAHDLFAQYMITNQNTPITPDNAADFVNNYMQNVQLPQGTSTVYTQSNLTIIPTNPASLLTYYNNIALLLTTYWPQNDPTDTIVQGAINDSDASSLLKLDPVVKSYQTIFTAMLKVSVPDAIVSLDLQCINSLEAYTADLQSVENTKNDPLTSLSALRTFQDSESDVVTSFTNLRQYFYNNNI